jgi:hypothetical protein
MVNSVQTRKVYYNNNIGECTSSQVIESDQPEYLAGTFVWSGFDYLGEARGWHGALPSLAAKHP